MRKFVRILSPSLRVFSIILTLMASIAAHAETGRKPQKHLRIPPVDRSLVGGVWRVDHSFVATIQVKNSLLDDTVDMTPVLYMADGTPFVLPKRTLLAHELAEINVNEALRTAPPEVVSHLSERGSVELRFNHSWNAVNATLQNLDVPRSLIYRTCFGQTVPLHPREKRRQKVEGLWWRFDDKTEGFIDLANTTNTDLQVSIRGASAGGERDKETLLQLAPHASASLRLVDLLSDKNLVIREGGLRIEYQGSLSSLFISAGTENAKQGFSAPMYFRDVTDKEAATPGFGSGARQVASVGIMAGKQDPMMGFPDGTEFTPYAIVRNTGAQDMSVAPAVQYFVEGKPHSLSLPSIQLSGGRTARLDVASSMAAAGVRNYSGDLHLIFNYTGVSNSILVAAGSVDQTGNYVFDVPARGVEARTGVDLVYFSERNGFDTMLTVWNPTSAAQDLLLTFNSQGGSYKVPIHMEAQGTAMFNASELAEQNKPDADGHTLPLGAFGTILLTNAQDSKKPFTALVEASTFNVKNATCGGVCDCGVYPVDVYVDGFPLSLPLGAGQQLTATLYWSDNSQSDATHNPYVWSSWDSTVASIGSNVGYASSVNPGSTTLDFFQGGYSAPFDMCWMYDTCDDKHSVEAEAPVNIASLSCTNSVTRAGTVSCTVSPSTGVTVSNWKFTDGSNNTVTRSTNTGSLTWSGAMVVGGTVQVTAAMSGTASMTLSASITVNNRTNFAFTAVAPTQLTGNSITCYDNTSVTLPSPPQPNSREGYSCADLAFSFNFSTISDNGPNQGYEYVTSASDQSGTNPTKYEYIVVSDALSATTFYNAQCGDFSSSNAAGFIAGSQLKQNIFNHEQGSTLSHWTEYRDAQNNSNNNIGVVLEAATAPPGSTGNSFAQNGGNAALSRIGQAVAVEPCGGLVNKDSSQSCKVCGGINYSPYQACNGTPVPYCQ